MARTNDRYKSAYNQMLARLKTLEANFELPSETVLASELGVSRTIIRSILGQLHAARIISWRGRRKRLLRQPVAADRFPDSEAESIAERLEDKFLEWILRTDVAPETRLNISLLSRQFGTTTHALQEFLVRFSRFGIVERLQTGGWVLRGFTAQYAIELSEFREMIELASVRKLVALDPGHPIWGQLDELERDHRALLEQVETRYRDFSALDDRLHTTINSVQNNRFAREFQALISMIFHYHYQWNKRWEKQRNTVAISEHLAYIGALRKRDWNQARAAALAHLATARQTLLASTGDNDAPIE
ncbi:GntR family transcriptional regulator [Pelagibacterium flavum]|uniref:GntR family transcriptional regulator n=1 Tax=Pelagibacterium flavum TaxID=2984530 RepID=A0ABY6IN00_9HYPH|nr:GntR family transcriptional regulator [Pelagibacterium sp. YIM 151497]UYQ71090.1 GntR family transcriptional regulator [Pelagibacterium sp. YIM 151497]